ncbi:hypothetical protein [Streptomyces sp. NPDC017529]|uniref:hypothetical protein n=1 Tax=Streptomyces sp. NPDC017529 TaxID=3365000 RepID=UPI0037A34339
MTTRTDTQPLTPDQLTHWLRAHLDDFDPDQVITPFTLTDIHPGLGWTRARNALAALHDAGLLHETCRTATYALRPDLPTSGNGHVWLRLTNRAGAPVEIIATQPRPADPHDAEWLNTRWTCTGCPAGSHDISYYLASEGATKHAATCAGQALTAPGTAA